MSLTTLAERILIEEDDDLFQCGCGRADDCTWCRLHREAEAAGMRRDETPPQWARRFLGKDDPPAHAIVLWLRKEQEAFAEEYAAALRLETLRAGDLTASQRERLEAGVLPEDEADEHLARLALGAVWDMPEYEPLQKTEVCGEYPSGVTFTKEEIKEYSDAAWKLRGEVLAACPGASITLTQHKGVCECRDHEYVYRTSMLVRARAPHGQVYSTRLKVDEKGGDTP